MADRVAKHLISGEWSCQKISSWLICVSFLKLFEEDKLIDLLNWPILRALEDDTCFLLAARRKVAACELRMSWSVNWSRIQNEYCMVESRMFNSLLLHMLPLENTSISYILLQLLYVFTRESTPIHHLLRAQERGSNLVQPFFFFQETKSLLKSLWLGKHKWKPR